MLDAWLESHPDDSGDTNESVTDHGRAEAEQPGTTTTERTTR